MRTRYVEMYSLVEWHAELRRSFCLGYDPYYYNDRVPEGMAASKARSLLCSLGVFFYRDIENGQGLILKPEIGSHNYSFEGSNIVFEAPLSCYFFNVEVAYPAIVPVDYQPPPNIVKAQPYLKLKEKWGDTKKWLSWNEPKQILQVTSNFIKHARR